MTPGKEETGKEGRKGKNGEAKGERKGGVTGWEKKDGGRRGKTRREQEGKFRSHSTGIVFKSRYHGAQRPAARGPAVETDGPDEIHALLIIRFHHSHGFHWLGLLWDSHEAGKIRGNSYGIFCNVGTVLNSLNK